MITFPSQQIILTYFLSSNTSSASRRRPQIKTRRHRPWYSELHLRHHKHNGAPRRHRRNSNPLRRHLHRIHLSRPTCSPPRGGSPVQPQVFMAEISDTLQPRSIWPPLLRCHRNTSLRPRYHSKETRCRSLRKERECECSSRRGGWTVKPGLWCCGLVEASHKECSNWKPAGGLQNKHCWRKATGYLCGFQGDL